MNNLIITKDLKIALIDFMKKSKEPDLIETYFFFLGEKESIQPAIFLREKAIYRSAETIIKKVEEEKKLWRETAINVQIGASAVNESTKKIYVCPQTGKVFGDNTHPHPQDAIYDWVSKHLADGETDGITGKRFFVSEDPKVIKNYIQAPNRVVKKVVFSSRVTGKLFHSKEAVIEDFKKTQIKPIAFREIPKQNRYKIEESFMQFIGEQLEEEQISAFIEAMKGDPELLQYIHHWLEGEAEEDAGHA